MRSVRTVLAFALLSGLMFVGPEAQAVDNCPFAGFHGSYHKATYHREDRNLSGQAVWRIWLRGESCVNRFGKITYIRWNKGRWVWDNVSNFWEWRGWEGTQNGGGVGQDHVFRRVNGHFELCYLEIGCVKDRYPWVQITMTNSSPWAEVSAGG